MTSQGVTGEGERPARRRRVEALPFTAEAKALDSRLRGNDEPRRDGRRVNDSFAVGEWKLMLRKIETKALDYARRLSRALRAIRCANVRSGILPPQSRLRGNDEQKGVRLRRLWNHEQRKDPNFGVEWRETLNPVARHEILRQPRLRRSRLRRVAILEAYARRQRHQDRLGTPARLQSEQRATVVHKIEFDVAPAPI